MFTLFTILLSSLNVALYLAVAVILVRKYLRTRDIGLAWLGGAVLIWPYVSGWLGQGEHVLARRVVSGHWVGFFPFSLVSHGEMTIGDLFLSLHLLYITFGAGLLLVAVIYLFGKKSDSKFQTMD